MSESPASGSNGGRPSAKKFSKLSVENRKLYTALGGVGEASNAHKLKEQVVKNLTQYVDDDMFNRMKEEIKKLDQEGQWKSISVDAPTLTCMLRELFELRTPELH